ncbi:hypothetical protein MMC07_007209 [Pseudocyphellaria aurata]|nr:hypothetical protein [Pseudocyphellaria aurata]
MTSLDIYTVTFNCGRELVKPEVFARHLFDVLPNSQESKVPNILILSLQEIAPISYSFLGGSFLVAYFDRFRHAVRLATASLDNRRYVNFITRSVGMTAIMGFVLEDQAEHIRSLATAGVGVGLQEMGNKGAVGLRFTYSVGDDAIELSVVAAHLAPMEDALERRNQDWKSIVQRLIFTPVGQDATSKPKGEERSQYDDANAPLLESLDSAAQESQLYKKTSYVIFAGDLNYRTSRLKPGLSDSQTFPQPTDDVDDPRHFSHLLKHDQLSREMKAERTCHGLQEAEINFPPTYKYSDNQRAVADGDNDIAWDWAKHRWPSWCDRILYLVPPSWKESERSPILVHAYSALPLMSTSDHRPVALSLSLPLTSHEAVADGNAISYAPFGIDPKWRDKRDAARRMEFVAGLMAYLGLTWEGNGILLALTIGALGGWAVIRGVFDG